MKDHDWELVKSNGNPTTDVSEASSVRVWINREKFQFIDVELFDRHGEKQVVVRASGSVAIYPEASNAFNVKIDGGLK